MKNFFSSKIFRFIWSAALAALIYMVCPPCFSKTVLLVLLAVQLLLINMAHIIGSFVIVTHIARVAVGGLFIFSGFIKANDPLGFSYKLQEYFEVFKEATEISILDTIYEWFAHMALPLAVIIVASELVLGIMLLIGFKRNLTLWLLFAQIAFFTFLTFYSACFNKVTHCGCFGDFWKLTPWESFGKDVALMILITLLFAGKENINPLFTDALTGTVFLIGLVVSVAFPIYAYRNLPPLDFRAYAPGMNIKDNMKYPPTYRPDSIETGFIYENIKTGEKKHFNMSNYPWQDTLNWKWAATDNVVIRPAIDAPKITDFNISSLDGANITDSLLNDKNYSFWLVAYDLSKTTDDEVLHAKINDFYKLAHDAGINFVAFTASGPGEISDFKHKYSALYDFATVDGTVLKTMIRSNPGLMLMKNGTVVANWHYNNFPVFSDVKSKLMK